MIMLMMGLLFGLVGLGFVGLLVTFLIPSLRSWRKHAFFIPVLAGVGGIAVSWGLAILGENTTGSSDVGGIGFFLGYVLGCLAGGFLGLVVARKGVAPESQL